MKCYCCSGESFAQCCAPVLGGVAQANTPLALMRSRFTAYCVADFDYVLQTYSAARRNALTVAELANSAQGARWFALQAQAGTEDLSEDQVEFWAFYFDRAKPAVLHETSTFVLENGQWRYEDGVIHDDTGPVKIGRNDLCPCLSGKKFKQCCLRS